MKFLIDEDLPRSRSRVISEYGYEPVDVRDIGLRGSADATIAEYSRKKSCCLISGDIGFADIRNYPPSRYSGIVVLRLPANATSLTILALLQGFLSKEEIFSNISGKLAIVETGRVRVRKD